MTVNAPVTTLDRLEFVEFIKKEEAWSKFFINYICQYSAVLDEPFIDEYSHLIDWPSLSGNEALPWSEELIERYEEKWSWGALSGNEALPWSEELIERYEEKWSWVSLSRNKNIPWTENILERFMTKWNWEALSGSTYLPWSDALIRKYEDNWQWRSDNEDDDYIGSNQNSLSSNPSLPWSLSLIEQFERKWDWWEIQYLGDCIPWDEELLIGYADRWDWRIFFPLNRDLLISNLSFETCLKHKDQVGLECFHYLTFTEELAERYEDEIPWIPLSCNDSWKWSESFISKHEERLEWSLMGLNKGLPWSEAFIDRYGDRLPWVNWNGLSANCLLPWSVSLIDRYIDRWDWRFLSSADYLPWSELLIARYKEKWEWDVLSKNKHIPWSIELIERYKFSWDWSELSSGEHLPWSEDLLGCFMGFWDWDKLSGNTSVPWDQPLIERFKRNLNWREFCFLCVGCLESASLLHFEELVDWEGLGFWSAAPWDERLLIRYGKTLGRQPTILNDRSLINSFEKWSRVEVIAAFDGIALNWGLENDSAAEMELDRQGLSYEIDEMDDRKSSRGMRNHTQKVAPDQALPKSNSNFTLSGPNLLSTTQYGRMIGIDAKAYLFPYLIEKGLLSKPEKEYELTATGKDYGRQHKSKDGGRFIAWDKEKLDIIIEPLVSEIVDNLKCSLFHMTHIQNLGSIIDSGLKCHNAATEYKDISNVKVNDRRDKEVNQFGNLHDFVPLYFNPRNAMLYQTCKKFNDEIIILEIDKKITLKYYTIFCEGNAARSDAIFTSCKKKLHNFKWDNIYGNDWTNGSTNISGVETKSIMMSECLVKEFIPSSFISRFHVKDQYVLEKIYQKFGDIGSDIFITPRLFF